MSSSTTPPLPAVNVSSNSNPDTINAALPPLLERWTLTSTNSGLQRSFKFKTFKRTWAFMDAVAAEAARAKHHPEWSNVYNTTLIRWTTHHPRGLSEADVQMAAFCDSCAAEHGELPAEKPSASVGTDVPAGEGDPLQALADGVVVEGGECCVPTYARKGAGEGAERVEGVVGEELHEKGP
ncbi:hypothetical protein VE03_08342 [Pseudogymnoascus sp. 23342-1-I1]|nr:hypothetical protein VE03_08342 [Pseudogymnoascus sp. 23342-1-I1]